MIYYLLFILELIVLISAICIIMNNDINFFMKVVVVCMMIYQFYVFMNIIDILHQIVEILDM